MITLLGATSVSVSLALVCAPAHGKNDECSPRIHAAIAKELRIEQLQSPRDGETVAAEACKAWPHTVGVTIAALAYRPSANTSKDTEHEKHLVVATIDRRSNRLISSHQRVIYEDALTEFAADSLRIDTAKYQLSQDLIAFGVRFKSAARGPSCGEAASWDELTLYVTNSRTLRPVLTLDMNRQRALDGCIGSATGRDVWEVATLTISVESTASGGYADLRIVAAITPGTNMDKVPAHLRSRKRVETYLLRYDGKSYSVSKDAPWWLGSL